MQDLNFVIQSHFKGVFPRQASPRRGGKLDAPTNVSPSPLSRCPSTFQRFPRMHQNRTALLSAVVFQIEPVTVSGSVTASSCFPDMAFMPAVSGTSVGTLMAQSQLHERIEAFKWQLPQRCAQFGVSAVFHCAFRSTKRSPSCTTDVGTPRALLIPFLDILPFSANLLPIILSLSKPSIHLSLSLKHQSSERFP